ncbi:tyrosine-type recombinase/integrase [Maribacter sp. Hel_I_7]|uniref:tyrosine-type recombinase/integrase n=1 Tax=Maribacter sp. Hel_I_7 TaxID=1249997 RepID=UPI0018CC11B3|nr:site-specific integrase [Maribacter sp. Hel_I_7]
MTIKTKFILRDYVNQSGKSPLYMFISSPGDRKRPKTELEFYPKDWDQKTERVKSTAHNSETYNLILENLEAKVSKIKTVYLLNEKPLTATKLAEELKETTERVDFKIFFKKQLAKEAKLYSKGYLKRMNTVLNKLQKYPHEIMFSDITPEFENKYRIYLASKGNISTTVNSNLATIKKFLLKAQKAGIKLPIEATDVKVGRTHGNRMDLKPHELERFYKYYFSEFITDEWKLILGYFLFSCFTSIRWGNIMDLKRQDIIEHRFVRFHVSKTNNLQTIIINEKALNIVSHHPQLFVNEISDVHMNREIKKIAKHLGYNHKISFHVARHTFATNFIRMKGGLMKLKEIMGHSDIKTTMIYVHIVEQEANEDMALMDKLF